MYNKKLDNNAKMTTLDKLINRFNTIITKFNPILFLEELGATCTYGNVRTWSGHSDLKTQHKE